MYRRTPASIIATLMAIAGAFPAAGQSVVKRIQTADARIASGVWVDNMFYLSGQLPSPQSPADTAKGTAAVYGNTEAQSDSVFRKIEELLKAQGLGMGDVVMMRVYLAA